MSDQLSDHSAARIVELQRAETDRERLRAENERLREALMDVIGAARVFNRNGMSWLEYDRLLAHHEALTHSVTSDETEDTR